MPKWPKLRYHVFDAKQQSISLFIKYLDISLHAHKVNLMATFLKFKWYALIHYKEIPAIYWMTLVVV